MIKLEKEVDLHLRSIQDKFNVKLTPKHHFMVHYSRVIRQMGPLVHMGMMRFESKHKFFKNIARGVNNFMNINKTLAITHQQFQCRQSDDTYTDILQNGRLLRFEEDIFNNHKDLLNDIFNCDVVYNRVRWFRCNNYLYKNGLIIIHQSKLYEICEILIVNEERHFICVDIDASGLDEYLNSLKIIQSDPKTYSLIHFKDLLLKSTYEKKRYNGEYYIIATNLELQKLY